MLFRLTVLEGVATGSVTTAYRRWARPRVVAGTQLRTAVGVVAVDSVDVLDDDAVARLTDDDARAAGHQDRAELMKMLDAQAARGAVHVVHLHFAGADGRIDLRATLPDPGELRALQERLDAMDRTSRRGVWTREVLTLIAEQPAVRAPDLAAQLGLETLPFKRDVRKLKELGLTESLDVGYRLSPRGRALLDAH